MSIPNFQEYATNYLNALHLKVNLTPVPSIRVGNEFHFTVGINTQGENKRIVPEDRIRFKDVKLVIHVADSAGSPMVQLLIPDFRNEAGTSLAIEYKLERTKLEDVGKLTSSYTIMCSKLGNQVYKPWGTLQPGTELPDFSLKAKVLRPGTPMIEAHLSASIDYDQWLFPASVFTITTSSFTTLESLAEKTHVQTPRFPRK